MTSLSLSPSLSLAKTSHLILSTPLFCNSIYTGCVASASPPPFPPHCSQRDQNTHRSTFLSALNTAGILSTLTVRAKVFPVVCALLPLPASSSPHPFAHSLVFPWSNQAVLPSRLFLCLRVSMSFSLTHIHLCSDVTPSARSSPTVLHQTVTHTSLYPSHCPHSVPLSWFCVLQQPTTCPAGLFLLITSLKRMHTP
jgi:hypothetical protein